MREILFRGKRVIDGKWTESVCPLGEMHGGTVLADYILATVGQYIGLTDKNGTRIFEGDIIKGKEREIFFVEYAPNIAGFVARSEKPTRWFPCLNIGTMQSYEVIGNIHDNADLLSSNP